MGTEQQNKKRSYPVLQALLLADHIYTDQSTNKRIICGTFSKIFCLRFPALTSFSCYAFVLLVDVIGDIEMQLRLVSLNDNEILMESNKARIKSDDPLTPLDVVFQIPPLPLPHEGIYSFECWTDDVMIGAVRLQAIQLSETGEDHKDD